MFVSKNIPTTNTCALYCNVMSSLLALHFCPAFSCPAISCPAISCPEILMVRHFHVRHFQSTRTRCSKNGVRENVPLRQRLPATEAQTKSHSQKCLESIKSTSQCEMNYVLSFDVLSGTFWWSLVNKQYVTHWLSSLMSSQIDHHFTGIR